MNRTEQVYSSTMQVMHEKHEKDREIPRENSQNPKKGRRVPGEHTIIMFLLCGIFLTAGWGGETALLRVALRFGMCKQPYKGPQPSTPECEDAGVLKDTPISTDDLKSPTLGRKR
jgi:hypothetical protein